MNMKLKDHSIMQKLTTIFICSIILLAFQKNSISQNNTDFSRSLNAVKTFTVPEIDGRLDEEAWNNVQFQNGFIQREPEEGAPASENTEIAVLYDENYLYIAAKCFDSEPDGIIGTEMRRDEETRNDDNFDIILDTFGDGRNAFYFTTNPLGARRDGTVSDEGRIDNSDWDGVWMCKTSINEEGWFVEVAIPWQTLRFKEGEKTSWKANFVRKIQRKNEDDYWKLIPRYAGRAGRFRMSEAGEITGFENLKMGGKFEIKPYVTGGLQKDNQTEFDMKKLSDTGVDVKANLTATMTADFTYNTDFAQVEADQEQVNLTRFSLYFPEKRGFFLEGAETFRFGETGRWSPWRPSPDNIQLFYSRKIGIENRQLVPVTGGTRLNGKAGKYTIGVLSIFSEETTILDDDDEEETVPVTNYTVLRLKRDVLTRSSIGLMVTNKHRSGGWFNRSIGLDSNFPVNERFSVFAAAAGTYSTKEAGEENNRSNNFAGNVGFKYESDMWEYNAGYLDIEDQFNPEIGFIRRSDIRKTEGKIQIKPRPQSINAIRQFNIGIGGEYLSDHNNDLLNRKFEGEFDVIFENTARLSFDIEREMEFLDENWEVRDGFWIPVGNHIISEYRLRYGFNRSTPISGSISTNIGDYYTGDKKGGETQLDLRAWNRLIMNTTVNYSKISLPGGNFNTTTISNRISYTFSPDMFVKSFIQWYDDKTLNDGNSIVSANIIFRYIYRPGSDLYLVYNQENHIGSGNDILENRTLLVKLNYFFRQ